MSDRDEKRFLSCCYLNPDDIDRGLEMGITPQHFKFMNLRAQWEIMLALRTESKEVDTSSVYTRAKETGKLELCSGLDGIVEASQVEPTSVNFQAITGALIDTHVRREIWRRSTQVSEWCKSGGAMTDILRNVGEMSEVSVGKKILHRSVKDIAKEVLEDTNLQLTGKWDNGKAIITGLPSFDRYATPIENHEYVVICARTSQGKSSLLAQMAGLNLHRGRRVAYYTLETSDKAVLRQMAGQHAGINVRQINLELVERQQAFIKEVKRLEVSDRLLIFDKLMRLDEIMAHARLLASSFKPDVVFLDYLNLVGVDSKSLYEHQTRVSKAMIPLRKSLGCALIVGAQLNRSNEKEERRPQRTDLRDSGSVEEDAHRIIAIWRKPNQPLDRQIFDNEILQLKLRDGPLFSVDALFHAPSNVFTEVKKESLV